MTSSSSRNTEPRRTPRPSESPSFSSRIRRRRDPGHQDLRRDTTRPTLGPEPEERQDRRRGYAKFFAPNTKTDLMARARQGLRDGKIVRLETSSPSGTE